MADPPPPPPVPVVSTPTPLPEATPAPPPAVFAVPAASPAATPEAPVSFEASVKPLLARTCTPCHVPGGRMYERRILRRLKNPDDRAVLERWLAGQPPG
ncbi:MAG: hypothetical protein DMF81_12925 [Acidobacteria bacterium]|nr:MAG: hypothetical protein DMF81_12925 [Acidobacteriota bacterium]